MFSSPISAATAWTNHHLSKHAASFVMEREMVPKASKGPSTPNTLQVSERERQQESSEQKIFYQLFSQDQISDSYDFKLHFPDSSDGKASAYSVGDLGSIPGSGRSPGEGNSNPLQYSCLENPMDPGAWERVHFH